MGYRSCMAKSPTDAEQFSEEETARRRDEAIRRALNTPPKPNKELVGKGNRPATVKKKNKK